MERKTVIIFIILAVTVLIVIGIFILGSNILVSLFKPHPGSCLILEEKYCKEVKFISNPNNPSSKVAVFKLPQGTTVFSPVGGYFSNTPTFFFKDNSGKYITYSGATVTVSKDNTVKTVEAVYNFIYFKEKERSYPSGVEKGQAISTILNKKISSLGDYNFVFSASEQKYNNGKIEYKSKDLTSFFK